ncbi:hypothetical protein BJ170DRAFT_687787 [Xylariales sp. AK1849]|nr:hypothetical protein BJ170DRAFT_687787 [Xylariales sp. AK1849]
MPSDDYASFSGGGALRLKGGKINKTKKRKKGKPSDLERSLSTGEASEAKELEENKKPGKSADGEEREAKEEENGPVDYKTETERRHEEFKRKKMLELAKSSSSRPELLKTHKERVEELNTYLSKLSEHHDMPKIGPG